MLSANMQDATDSDENSTTFYAFTVGNQIKIAREWNVSLSAVYNKNVAEGFDNTSMGPLLNINRSFSEGKFRSAFSATMLNSYLNDSLQNKVLNASMTNNIRVGKKHSFAVNLYYLKSEQAGVEGKSFSETRAMFNYNYNF
jgi:hypothetical protein